MILILLIWTMEVKPLAMMSPMFVDVIAHIVSGLFFKDNSSQFDVKKFQILNTGNGYCYVIVFIVSYRGITNSRFSLTQSKLYIF